ncbi:acyl-CoA thioesterase [Aestuariicella hydrocarbonica]|uniref:Acyl-CoA thioesterase n=1 Tax=Pseudomaricurvus hydrocarbonicus TaxID=1470433 RepID=A0A9E5T259_9GAMM|nr:acyl-CoA thioesterase [Aestuariicella hydrocarbonica]
MSIDIITPRFCETDALGHINNVSYAAWLEQGRTGFFTRNAPHKHSPLMLVKLEINYRHESFHGTDVEVHTHLTKLGNSTFTLAQTIFQKQVVVVEAISVLVRFDSQNKRSLPFDDVSRAHWSALLK